jgi:hypothetical protein
MNDQIAQNQKAPNDLSSFKIDLMLLKTELLKYHTKHIKVGESDLQCAIKTMQRELNRRWKELVKKYPELNLKESCPVDIKKEITFKQIKLAALGIGVLTFFILFTTNWRSFFTIASLCLLAIWTIYFTVLYSPYQKVLSIVSVIDKKLYF